LTYGKELPVPESAPGEEPHIGHLLFIPYRSMERRVFDALAAAGHPISPAQARLFQRIAAGGSRVTELAEQARVTKQTAGFLIGQLERAGYVERVPDPADARARIVRIAPRGAAVVPIAAGAVAEVEAEWTLHLGPRRMGQLRQALARLREVTDPLN
jgi:DNA-binding MarR family transcriptional regulator